MRETRQRTEQLETELTRLRKQATKAPTSTAPSPSPSSISKETADRMASMSEEVEKYRERAERAELIVNELRREQAQLIERLEILRNSERDAKDKLLNDGKTNEETLAALNDAHNEVTITASFLAKHYWPFLIANLLGMYDDVDRLRNGKHVLKQLTKISKMLNVAKLKPNRWRKMLKKLCVGKLWLRQVKHVRNH
jgi:DNA repair exonuclease SbcCD ATPase subunit